MGGVLGEIPAASAGMTVVGARMWRKAGGNVVGVGAALVLVAARIPAASAGMTRKRRV